MLLIDQICLIEKKVKALSIQQNILNKLHDFAHGPARWAWNHKVARAHTLPPLTFTRRTAPT
jgi:hypothetical protein